LAKYLGITLSMTGYYTIQGGVFPVNNPQDLTAAALVAVVLAAVALAAVAPVAVGNDTPLISLLITNPCGFFK
jgi:hypothetical protein